MKGIKFKAFDKVMEKMYEVGYIDFAKERVQLANIVDGICYAVYISPLKDVELLRYTGLKDKNDKEIYEGDILKVTTVRGDTRWQMEVDFENGCFALKEGPELWKLKYDYPNHEVIGNIYENPELLEESK